MAHWHIVWREEKPTGAKFWTLTIAGERFGRMGEAEMEAFFAAGRAEAVSGKEREDRKTWAVEKSWERVGCSAASQGIF